jgi:hypothetical protein
MGWHLHLHVKVRNLLHTLASCTFQIITIFLLLSIALRVQHMATFLHCGYGSSDLKRALYENQLPITLVWEGAI